MDKIEASEAFTGEETLLLLTKADLLLKLMACSAPNGEQRAAAREIEKLRRKRRLSWAEISGSVTPGPPVGGAPIWKSRKQTRTASHPLRLTWAR